MCQHLQSLHQPEFIQKKRKSQVRENNNEKGGDEVCIH